MSNRRRLVCSAIVVVGGITVLVASRGDLAGGQSPTGAQVKGEDDPIQVLAQAREELGRNRYAAFLHLQAARAYQLLGDQGSEEREVESATESDPLSAYAYMVLASVRERRGDLKGSLAALQEAVKLDPLNPVSRCSLGRLLEINSDSTSALHEYEACRESLTHARYVAYAPDSAGKLAEEITDPSLLAIVADQPCLKTVRFSRQRFYVDKDGGSHPVSDLQAYSVAQIERLESNEASPKPASRVGERRLVGPQNQSPCALSIDPAVLLAEAQRKLAEGRNPEWARWHERSARAYFALGDFRSALDAVEAAIRVDPLHTPAYYFAAEVSMWARPTSEFAFIAKGLELDPENPLGHFLLGDYFERKKDLQKALKHYSLCIDNLKRVRQDGSYKDAQGHLHFTLGLRGKADERISALSMNSRSR